MLKMKLPQRKSKHKADDDDEDEEEERSAAVMCSRPCSLRECPVAAAAPAAAPLQRQAVYEWFVQSLGPAHRLEFACGLLDLCNPLELRFLGSCLEDLARKDCHYLRDCESRANGLAAEPGLQHTMADLSDRAARSKLIVYLALLSSENREVAGRLYRLLLLPAMSSERVLEDAEELLLLFTMASLHPAFSFHQRVTLRERVRQLRDAMCAGERHHAEGNIQEYLPNHEKHVVDGSMGTYNGVTSSHSLQQEAVHIEKISCKHVQRRRADKNSEYTFEVTWSDNSKTLVTKSHRELVEFLLTLPKELSNAHIDKTIINALHLGKRRDEHQYSDLGPIVQQIFSSPAQALLQNQRVYTFFHNVQTESGHPSHLQKSSKCCKTSEDSSETSSQEEDGMHHTAVYKKSGKSLVTNFVAVKSSSRDAIQISHLEQNGTDWRKNDCMDPVHPSRYFTDGHQRTLERCSSHLSSRENPERSNQKVDGRSTCKVNGVKSSHISRVTVVKDPTLEFGSGHETCGETSSESYSSPPSPRHSRRESFESEEEKDRDTDSNSEDSSKHVPGSQMFGSVKTSSAKLSDHLTSNGETIVESMNGRNFTPFSRLPALHCMMPTNVEKLEPGHPLRTEGKTLGMMVSPVSVHSVRDVIHQNSLGIGVATIAPAMGESEKCGDMLTSPMSVPPTFLSRNCTPSSPALQMPLQRLKVPTQGSAEACTVNGSPQTNVCLGTASAGFISVHSHGGFAAPPVTASDQVSKPISQVASLNQAVPHLEGSVGIVSPATNVKLVLSGTNLTPAPSTIPYPLSGPSLPSGVLPTPNTNVLNAAAPQPTNNCIGQVQSAVPLTVPTHSPGPAPSPSPALTHSTAQSDSTSFISAAVGNSSNGTLLPPQQMGNGACGSCGRRCGCGVPMGSYYYPNPMPGQMFTRVPFPFTIPSICNSTYLNQAHQSNGTHYPVYLHQPPYTNGLMHDPVLGGQANYGMQQMTGFTRLYPIYPATNVVGSANGSVAKKNGNISCFNCGVAGHYAQDCKQPPMDANQQGTFRLRYAPLLNPSHDSLDSAD